MSKYTQVAVIGGSFAWLSALLALRKRLGKNANVKVFDKRDKFTYIPWLHETLMAPPKALESMQMDINTYFPGQFINQEVVTLELNRLTTENGETRTFDYLIIATGSRTNFFNNYERQKNAYTVRYAEDIPPLNKALENAWTITVIGWWYTGIEVAAVIAQRKNPSQHLRVIHSRERLFNRLSKEVSARCENRLRKRWVDIILWAKVKDIKPGTITLASWKSYQSDVTIASRWITTNDELHKPTFTFDNKRDYTPKESDTVFICGDVAVHGLYTTAHNAMMEGRRMGYIVADRIQDTPRHYPPLANRDKLAIALGTRDGIITNGTSGIYFPWFTWLAKKIIEKRVLLEFKYKIMLWI